MLFSSLLKTNNIQVIMAVTTAIKAFPNNSNIILFHLKHDVREMKKKETNSEIQEGTTNLTI